MSLSVLKKKANTKYNKLSSRGNSGFSLNNPRRVYSHTNKVQTQTPMKGNVPRGHGTCCGNYPIVINKSQYNNYDSHNRLYSGEKSNQGISVKNNQASISTRNKWLKRGYPHYIVKDMEQLDYEQYIQKLHQQSAGLNVNSLQNGLLKDNCHVNKLCKKKVSTIVKDVNVLDNSTYLRTKFLNKKCLPTPSNKLHYPVPINGQCSSSLNIINNDHKTKGVCCT